MSRAGQPPSKATQKEVNQRSGSSTHGLTLALWETLGQQEDTSSSTTFHLCPLTRVRLSIFKLEINNLCKETITHPSNRHEYEPGQNGNSNP